MRYQKTSISDTITSHENAVVQVAKAHNMYVLSPGIPGIFSMKHSYAVVAGYEVHLKNTGSSVDVVHVRMYARNTPNTFFMAQVKIEAGASKTVYIPNMNGVDCLEIFALSQEILFYNIDLLRVQSPANIGKLNSPISLLVTPSRNLSRGFTQDGVVIQTAPHRDGEVHISIQSSINVESLFIMQIISSQEIEMSNSDGLLNSMQGHLYFSLFGRDFMPPMLSFFLRNNSSSTANMELKLALGTYFASAADRYNHGYSNIAA